MRILKSKKTMSLFITGLMFTALALWLSPAQATLLTLDQQNQNICRDIPMHLLTYDRSGIESVNFQGSLGTWDYSALSLDNPVTTPVPESGTMVLVGAGMLILAIFGKRRNNKKA